MYGKWDGKQIAKAERQLAGMKKQVASSGPAWKRWGAGINQASNAAAVGLGGIAALAAKGVQSYQTLASSVANLQRQTKISAQDASLLVGQWQRYGVSIEQGTKAMTMLSKQQDAANQGSKVSIESFQRLGITMEQLKTMSPAQMLETVRQKLAAMPPSAAKTALASKLMGRGFQSMSKWAAASDKDIADLNQTLADTGQVMDAAELAKAKSQLKEQAAMAVEWRGIMLEIGRSAMPIMRSFTKALSTGMRVMGPFADKLGYVAIALAGFIGISKTVKAISDVTGALKGMSSAIRGLSGASKGLKGVGKAVEGITYKNGSPIAAPLGGAGTGAAGGAAAGSASALAAAIAPVVVIAAMTALPLVLARTQKYVAGKSGAAASRQGQAAGGAFWGSSKGYGGGSGRARMALAEAAKKGVEDVNAAIRALEAKASTQTGAQFRESIANLANLREAAKKPWIVGNLNMEHTDGQLRTLRDRMMSELGITLKQADALMATMFKDWRPQDQLMPKINKAAAATENRIDLLRKRAGKDIRLGGMNATELLNEIGSVTSEFDGMRNAARQAANAAANALRRQKGARGAGRVDKGGAGQLGYALGGISRGPSSGYLQLLHGTEAILPLGNPKRTLQVLRDAGILADEGRYAASQPALAGRSTGPGTVVQFTGCTFAADQPAQLQALVKRAATDAVAEAKTRDLRKTGTGY